jgi:hypothetical protein
MANRNGKTQRSRSNTAATPTVESTALALPQITRARANEILKARAVELYHQARSAQQHEQRAFEEQFGRADRIDAPLLAELQHLQMRFAAIAARQQRQPSGNEPKVNRFVKALGEIIGDVTVALATDRALELFSPIDEHDYLGYGHNGSLGRKGYDESVLAQYRIVDDPKPVAPTHDRDDDPDEVCLHEAVEPDEDEPTRGTCPDCGAEFDLTLSPPTES